MKIATQVRRERKEGQICNPSTVDGLSVKHGEPTQNPIETELRPSATAELPKNLMQRKRKRRVKSTGRDY